MEVAKFSLISLIAYASLTIVGMLTIPKRNKRLEKLAKRKLQSTRRNLKLNLKKRKKHTKLGQDARKLFLDAPVKVIIDLEFANQSKDRKETNSLFKQVSFAFGNMKRPGLYKPMVSLIFTNYTDYVSSIGNNMGVTSWPFVRSEISTIDYLNELNKSSLEKPNVIYLSPDSPNTLESVDPLTIYIIGGIVDKTVRKNESLLKANELGVSTAKLPIYEHSLDTSKTQVLNIEAVILSLNAFASCKSWKESFEFAMPQREWK